MLVIGAGITGLHQLHSLLTAGFRSRLLKAGTGVGGTWYWNRYPGARFDSESSSYGYFFSPELRDEWNWSEEFAGQPETEHYLNLAADQLGLRPFIVLNSRVASATYLEDEAWWEVATTTGVAHSRTCAHPRPGSTASPRSRPPCSARRSCR